MPPEPPGAAMHVMAVGDPETMAWDIDSFASGMIDADPEPGDTLIRYYAWSSDPIAFVVINGTFQPANERAS
jgi:hypothetical protein